MFLRLRPRSKTRGPFSDSVDQDQTAQNMQSDLALHCPIERYFSQKHNFGKAIFGILHLINLRVI